MYSCRAPNQRLDPLINVSVPTSTQKKLNVHARTLARPKVQILLNIHVALAIWVREPKFQKIQIIFTIF